MSDRICEACIIGVTREVGACGCTAYSSRIVRTGSWLRTDAALWRAVRSIFIVKSSKFEHQHTQHRLPRDARHREPAAHVAPLRGTSAAALSLNQERARAIPIARRSPRATAAAARELSRASRSK